VDKRYRLSDNDLVGTVEGDGETHVWKRKNVNFFGGFLEDKGDVWWELKVAFVSSGQRRCRSNKCRGKTEKSIDASLARWQFYGTHGIKLKTHEK
jgi:hypothetical protein